MMEDLFGFEPIGEPSGHHRWIRGVVMTIYDNSIGLSTELYELMGKPARAEIEYSAKLRMIGIRSKGRYTVTSGNSNAINSKALCTEIRSICGQSGYFRILDGHRQGDYIVFNIDNIETFKKGVRNV